MQFASGKDPVLYLTNPEGVSPQSRRAVLDALAALNRLQYEQRARPGDRVAHRPVRDGLPDADERAGGDRPRRSEPESVLEPLRAGRPTKPGTFAANCLLARRLAERGVRFIQLYHQGWDQHGDLPGGDPRRSASETDQPAPR